MKKSTRESIGFSLLIAFAIIMITATKSIEMTKFQYTASLFVGEIFAFIGIFQIWKANTKKALV